MFAFPATTAQARSSGFRAALITSIVSIFAANATPIITPCFTTTTSRDDLASKKQIEIDYLLL